MLPGILEVALGANDAYSIPLGVTIYSVLANYSGFTEEPAPKIRFWILDSGISARNKASIERIVAQYPSCLKIEWLQPDPNLLPKFRTQKTEPYLRLLLDRLLPQEVARILWLDCDIVVEGNVLELWQHDTENRIIGAVIDYGSPTVGFSYGTSLTYEECGVASETPHFNSGVMIIDIPRWRQAKVTERVLDYSVRFEDKLAYMDQDGLNIVVEGDWTPLPMNWNVQIAALCALERLKPSIQEGSIENQHFVQMLNAREELLAKPQLIHYISGKPWNSGLRMPLYPRWFWWLQRSAIFNSKDFQLYRLKCHQQAWTRAIRQRLGK